MKSQINRKKYFVQLAKNKEEFLMKTIAAISTATGTGGIGIIRLSGDKTFEILKKIFIPKNKKKSEEIKGYTIL